MCIVVSTLAPHRHSCTKHPNCDSSHFAHIPESGAALVKVSEQVFRQIQLSAMHQVLRWLQHISPHREAVCRSEDTGVLQVIVAERGPLVWVFNFSPTESYEGLKVSSSTHVISFVCLCRLASTGRHATSVPFLPTGPAAHSPPRVAACPIKGRAAS